MIVHECTQGSSKWLALRCRRPTASACDRIITPTGKPSSSASGYVNELLAEIMLGRPLAGVLTGAMQRGKDFEDEARKYYELVKDCETVPVGFLTTDDGRIGASPDRLVENDGLVEVKAPLAETHGAYLSAHIDAMLDSKEAEAGAAKVYRCQIQCQLFVAEREWCDIISYFPGLPEIVTRVNRDDKFIALMKAQLYQFVELLDTRREKLRSLGYIKDPAPESEDVRAFGLTAEEIEDHIAALKREGVLTT